MEISSKITYYHGTMGSGKTLDLIRTAYNYRERGMVPRIYKPSIDTRDGAESCVIKTRIGMELPALWIDKELDKLSLIEKIKHDCGMLSYPDVIIVDECQFLTEEQVNGFQQFALDYATPIIFYGLKVDFTGHLFEGSKRLFEIADTTVELKGICHCGKIARQNARVVEGEIQKQGEIVAIGGNEMYVPLCNSCFARGVIK